MKNKKEKSLARRVTAVVLGITMAVSMALTGLAGAAPITYTGGGYTFEKLSHPQSGAGEPDGVVDYIGYSRIGVTGQTPGAVGQGDRGQSYSYAAEAVGDWVYINTMYGGLSVANIISQQMGGVGSQTALAGLDVLYNGHMYMGEPDKMAAGGILFKFNARTGETKVLMSYHDGVEGGKGLIPTFRGSCQIDGKLYFVGMVVDANKPGATAASIIRDLNWQQGSPVLYEVDPANDDRLTCVYRCVDDYNTLVAQKIFTSTRAITTYAYEGKEYLIAAGLQPADETNGQRAEAFLVASADPSAGQQSFHRIAGQDDFDNEPALYRDAVNAGAGIYQILQYKDKLYVVVLAGSGDTLDPKTGVKRAFAIYRGECSGDPTEASSWKWSCLAGDKKNGAKYTYGLDETRISAGACTLQVYDGYLYIGDYNDVSSALQGFATDHQFLTQATNLKQSINLYRMDADEKIEMVVGDKNPTFGKSLTGLGSGYGNHMNQYTWQTTVYDGKMWLSTMDTTTLLEPMAELFNGDLLRWRCAEWKAQANYLKVMLTLMYGRQEAEQTNGLTAEALVAGAEAENGVTLTAEQRNELVEGLMSGEIVTGQEPDEELIALADGLEMLAVQGEEAGTEAAALACNGLLQRYERAHDKVPHNQQIIYDVVLSHFTGENLWNIARSVRYFVTSKRGFDLFTIEHQADGSVRIEKITDNGFGDPYNHGLRIFAKTTKGMLIGTANPFYGTQLWYTK